MIEINDLRLPIEMRSRFKDPMGELIEGTPKEVSPKLIEKLTRLNQIVVCVGDVVSEMLISRGYFPSIVVTDGTTKRTEEGFVGEFSEYEKIYAKSPPGEISSESWEIIRSISSQENLYGKKIHLIIDGEEDLLALPFIVELPQNAVLIYGQPNLGAVVIIISRDKKRIIKELLEGMEKISK